MAKQTGSRSRQWSKLAALCVNATIASVFISPPAAAARGGAAQSYPPGVGQIAAERALEAEISTLGRRFDGDIGIAVQDVETGFVAEFDGRSFFPQQSVSKLWVALTALHAEERGVVDLTAPVTLRRSDLTLFHQPIARKIRASGHHRSTLAALMKRALQQSDNTCNDFVLRKIGGPEAVRSFLKESGIEGVRFGPGERIMQSRVAGLTWRQEYSIGDAFFVARSTVPLAKRRAAFDNYVANPVDGATPVAMVDALARLKQGRILSSTATKRLLDIMSRTKTGPQRMKAGLSPGWSLAHKTGTGQQIGRMQTGYNDVGIITSPTGRSYTVAVMIRRTSAPVPARMAVMQNVVRALIRYDRAIAAPAPLGAGITVAR